MVEGSNKIPVSASQRSCRHAPLNCRNMLQLWTALEHDYWTYTMQSGADKPTGLPGDRPVGPSFFTKNGPPVLY